MLIFHFLSSRLIHGWDFHLTLSLVSHQNEEGIIWVKVGHSAVRPQLSRGFESIVRLGFVSRGFLCAEEDYLWWSWALLKVLICRHICTYGFKKKIFELSRFSLGCGLPNAPALTIPMLFTVEIFSMEQLQVFGFWKCYMVKVRRKQDKVKATFSVTFCVLTLCISMSLYKPSEAQE